MLSENIKKIRKQNGLTQEAFAIRLHVVRQTVSKWEKGLSVPDAQTLQRISEEFEIPVQELLGNLSASEVNQNEIADQLAKINEQLAIRNHRAANGWKAVCLVLLVCIGFLMGKVYFGSRFSESSEEASRVSLPDTIEASNVRFNGNNQELICSFVPSIGNPEIIYTVTLYDQYNHDNSIPGQTVVSQYENGICTAVFDKSKLSKYVDYSVVLNMKYKEDIRNLTLAEDLEVSEDSYSWKPLWD